MNFSSFKEIVRSKLPLLFKVLTYSKNFLHTRLVNMQKRSLPGKIERLYGKDEQTNDLVAYLKNVSVEMIPYFYTEGYRNMPMTVDLDADTGYKVVLINNNKIFFPAAMKSEYIVDSVRVGLMEQDDLSPHKYLPTASVDIGGDIAILCGASDGMYALDIINKFEKLYLFEANPEWIGPIHQTLRNFLHKVEIIPMRISSVDSDSSITLDTFLRDKKGVVNYIQADIEGAELELLKGAQALLRQETPLQMSLCCYHSSSQQKELTDYLEQFNFEVKKSHGFLLMWMQYPLHPPYLRAGVLYVTRAMS